MYVIKNNDKDSRYCNNYVTIVGHIKSYTSNLNFVRYFANRKDAERAACDNERVVELLESCV